MEQSTWLINKCPFFIEIHLRKVPIQFKKCFFTEILEEDSIKFEVTAELENF